MRLILPEKLSAGRVRTGEFGSPDHFGPYGVFYVHGPCGEILKIVASGADDPESEGWEHVSISIKRRLPNWTEMAFVKNLFWKPTETVVQFHPRESEYVNNHPHCLHLWRPIDDHIRLPPSILVGQKDLGILTPKQAAELRGANNGRR